MTTYIQEGQGRADTMKKCPKIQVSIPGRKMHSWLESFTGNTRVDGWVESDHFQLRKISNGLYHEILQTEIRLSLFINTLQEEIATALDSNVVQDVCTESFLPSDLRRRRSQSVTEPLAVLRNEETACIKKPLIQRNIVDNTHRKYSHQRLSWSRPREVITKPPINLRKAYRFPPKADG